MNLVGFIYAHFRWLGIVFLKVFRNLDEDLKAADVRLHPEVYASLMGFTFLLITLGGIGFSVLIAASSMGLIPIPIINVIPFLNTLPQTTLIILLAGIVCVVSLGSVALMAFMPSIGRTNRTSKLSLEVPYLAAYISTMASGGISPYISFERLAKSPEHLFSEIKKEALRFFINVRAFGKDPLSAIEESAKRIPNRPYRELMLGYVATLRAGGDVVHYLQRQTEVLFKDRISEIRAIAERIGMIMEAYMAVVVLLALSIYSMFIVNKALVQASLPLMSGGEFFLFSYVLMPLISGLFIYLADLMQPKYPVADYRPYYVYFAVSVPLTVVLAILMVTPYFVTVNGEIFIISQRLVSSVVDMMGLGKGYETGVGLALAMIIGLIPACIWTERILGEYRGIEFGITRFLRDLVEVRKTGMSPEKCIIDLSRRDYGKFSKHLKYMAKRIGWGRPMSSIYEDFARDVRSWLARIVMFLLVESIEVGGGTPETLESLANFAEMIELVEKEKKRMLKPLILIPYIGSLVTTCVIIMLIGFMNNIMKLAHMSVGVITLTRTFLPPVVLNSYITGLTAGKISNERVCSGFLHALFLVFITLIAMMASPYISRMIVLGG